MNECLVAFGISEKGSRHEKSGTVCQDSTLYYYDSDLSLAIAAVSDGHGSEECFRSDKGAQFAVESAVDCIKKFVAVYRNNINFADLNNIKYSEIMAQLSNSIILEWNEKIAKDYADNPFELKLDNAAYDNVSVNVNNDDFVIAQAYGATLIAVAVTETYCFGLQIGDGRCVVMNEDKSICEPIPSDDRCYMNITTSMCDFNAAQEFRYYFGIDKKPAAIFINTDGVDNSLADDSRLHDLYSCIYEDFISKGIETGITEIKKFLPELTKKGSGDDVSIAGIININCGCGIST